MLSSFIQSILLNKDEFLLEEIRISYPEMPFKLYHKISKHLKSRSLRQQKCDANILINSLPFSLRNHLLLAMYKQTIDRLKIFNNVQKLNFCALGDNIHGAIHNEPRVECREDRAKELMVASEIIAQALAKLSESVPHVVYRSVFGNHDRMTANLKESLDNYTNIIKKGGANEVENEKFLMIIILEIRNVLY